MMSRTLVSVLLSLHIVINVIDLSNAEDEPVPSVNHSTNTIEHKLLLECQHPDYRTYIKCLKRQKRHHWHNDHDEEGGETKKCFDDCGMDRCESTKCVHECHTRCMKKTKETRQIITQYETTCDSGDCGEKSKIDQPATNITTNIDINNVINNHMPKPNVLDVPKNNGRDVTTGTNTGCIENGNPQSPTGTRTTPGGTNCQPPVGPNWTGTNWGGSNIGLTLVPQIQFVPQITFGLGLGSIGNIGGGWPSGPQPGGIDCSQCGNPFMRYRCDVSCYAVQNSGPMRQNTGIITGGESNPCKTPQCVGGSY